MAGTRPAPPIALASPPRYRMTSVRHSDGMGVCGMTVPGTVACGLATMRAMYSGGRRWLTVLSSGARVPPFPLSV
jgi:hypothetical protein